MCSHRWRPGRPCSTTGFTWRARSTSRRDRVAGQAAAAGRVHPQHDGLDGAVLRASRMAALSGWLPIVSSPPSPSTMSPCANTTATLPRSPSAVPSFRTTARVYLEKEASSRSSSVSTPMRSFIRSSTSSRYFTPSTRPSVTASPAFWMRISSAMASSCAVSTWRASPRWR